MSPCTHVKAQLATSDMVPVSISAFCFYSEEIVIVGMFAGTYSKARSQDCDKRN